MIRECKYCGDSIESLKNAVKLKNQAIEESYYVHRDCCPEITLKAMT